jgi:hypothetical protein
MIKKEQLKEDIRAERLSAQIKKKFGSINAFANHRANNIEPWILFRALNGTRKKDRTIVLNQIEFFLDLNDERRIKPQTRRFVRNSILSEFDSFADFSKKYPEFSTTFLSNFVKGNKVFLDTKSRNLVKVVYTEINEIQYS